MKECETTPPLAFLALFACALFAGACEGECDPGDTTCDGDVILICVEGDSEDEYWDEDEESCGFFCDIINIWDEATDAYWQDDVDCDEDGKTCVEKTDPSGVTYATCAYSQDY